MKLIIEIDLSHPALQDTPKTLGRGEWEVESALIRYARTIGGCAHYGYGNKKSRPIFTTHGIEIGTARLEG